MKLALLAAAALAAAVLVPLAAAAMKPHPAPVRVIMDPKLGHVLATKTRHALYTWRKEKAGTIRCTGACAKAWPPLLVSGPVAKHVKGVMGTFGTIRRPDGKTQLTWNRHALYRYQGDPKGVAKCNGVDRWFAVKG